MTLLSALVAAWWLLVLLTLALGFRKLHSLQDLPATIKNPPKVSIVVPARNESRKIRDAMQSLLAIDYPGLEIIAVNDRSTDDTGEVLEELASDTSALHVVHVRELPEGWLGKLHAMQEGAYRAKGDLLLFTDADVQFEPDTVSRAVRYLEGHGFDHVCCLPELINSHWSMRPMVPVFSVFLALHSRPWKASDPSSSAHMGIGAFNLVRRECFERIHGFEDIRLRPDDDIMLGKRIKREGFRQDVLLGEGKLRVEWYHHALEMIHGLEKNSFAVFDYSVPRMLGASLLSAFTCLWPVVGVFATGTPTLLAAGTALGIMLLLGMETSRRQGLAAGWGLLFPLGAVLIIIAMMNSMIRTLHRGGIRWRETFYPLELLRRNRL